MKFVIAVFAVLAAASAVPPAGTATIVDHEKLAAGFNKTTYVIESPDCRVAGAHRAGPGQVEVHDKEIDVMYIVDGDATFVSGGTMIGGKNTSPGQWLGSEIQGGESRHVVKGDMIMVPAGVPHWYKEIPGSLSYVLVKIIK